MQLAHNAFQDVAAAEFTSRLKKASLKSAMAIIVVALVEIGRASQIAVQSGQAAARVIARRSARSTMLRAPRPKAKTKLNVLHPSMSSPDRLFVARRG
jgi:hypothetical protein